MRQAVPRSLLLGAVGVACLAVGGVALASQGDLSRLLGQDQPTGSPVLFAFSSPDGVRLAAQDFNDLGVLTRPLVLDRRANASFAICSGGVGGAAIDCPDASPVPLACRGSGASLSCRWSANQQHVDIPAGVHVYRIRSASRQFDPARGRGIFAYFPDAEMLVEAGASSMQWQIPHPG